MKTPHKWVCTSLVALALTAGCGGGDDKTTTTTTTPAAGPAPTTTLAGGRISPPSSSNAAAATDGAICSPSGAKGRTSQGIALVCVPIAGGNESRWRPE
jgi:hypothetical protein